MSEQQEQKQSPMTVNINPKLHAILTKVRADRGVQIKSNVDFAIRAWIEKYYPDYLDLLDD